MPRNDRDEPLDYESEEDLSRIVRLAASAGVHYSERADGSLLKWLLGIAAGVILLSASGAFALSSQVAGLVAKVDGLQRQIDDVKRIVEPHYSITKENQ